MPARHRQSHMGQHPLSQRHWPHDRSIANRDTRGNDRAVADPNVIANARDPRQDTPRLCRHRTCLLAAGYLRRLRNHIDNVRDTPEPWCGSAAMISCRFGFCDHAQFSRLFGAGFNLTPSAWRKLWVQAPVQVPRFACDHPCRFHYPARGLEYRKPCGQSAAIRRRRGDAAGWRVRRNGRQGAGRA